MLLLEMKKTTRLAYPLIASLLANVALEFIDVVMMARLGAEELAAGGLSESLYLSIFIFSLGIVLSVGIFASRAYGEKDSAGVSKVIRAGLWLVIFCSIIGMLLTYLMPNFLLLIKQDPKISFMAGEYARAVLWALPTSLGFIALREFVTVVKHPRIVMYIAIFSLPANAFLNWVFMYGNLGVDSMGVAGAGWSTALVSAIGFLWLLFFAMKHPQFKQYTFLHQFFKIDFKQIILMLHVGWPIGVALFFEIGLFSVSALLMGYFGAEALASHHIAI